MQEAIKVWLESTTGRTGWGANPASLPGSPVLNTDYALVRIVDNNAFTMRQVPKSVKWLKAAGSNNLRVQRIATQWAFTGQLKTVLYPSQAPFFLGFLTPNGSSNDLPSMIIDHQITLEDNAGTISYHRYLGAKVTQAVISGNAEDQAYTLTLDLVAKQQQSPQITVADFGIPALTAYPSELPYCFVNTSSPGYLKLMGSTRAEYSSFDLTIRNTIDATYNESPYVTRSRYKGREVDWQDRFILTSNQDRLNYESGTPYTTCETRIDNGTNHVIFTFGNANYIDNIDDDLSFDKNKSQTIRFSNALDATAGTDLTITTG